MNMTAKTAAQEITLQAKLLLTKQQLNSAFIDREKLIDGVFATLLAGGNALLYGEPGTAKSEIIRAVCGAIAGAEYFQRLLHKAQPPDEILGQLSLKELENDRLVRNTTGRLPEAHIAFLDELFRCSPTTLNSLLGVLNERVIENPSPVKIPLMALFSASNSIPDEGETELQALWDRFIYRPHVTHLKERGRARLLDWVLDGDRPEPPKDAITLEELAQMQAEARSLPMSLRVRSELLTVLRALGESGFKISDRRVAQLANFLRCYAYVQGHQAVYVEHFEVLPACIWSKDLQELTEVGKAIQTLAPPVQKQIKGLIKTAEESLVGTVTMMEEKAPDSDNFKDACDMALIGLNKTIQRVTEIRDGQVSCLPESKYQEALDILERMKDSVVTAKNAHCY